MKDNRTKNAARNLLSGGVLTAYQILVPFIMRTIIIYRMGAAYSGLNNLFGSVLSVLNLAELGIGAAMNFSMYAPIAKGETSTICALMNLYRKYYAIIGGVILAVGLMLTPLVPKLARVDTVPGDINVYIFYFLYLGSCVVSYWLYPDRLGLMNAHQRMDVSNKITLLTTTIAYGLQIVIIFTLKNFYLYTAAYMVMEIVYRLILGRISDRMFPEFRPRGKLSREAKGEIYGRIRDLFTAKLGTVVVESVDSVVASAYLGLTVLAIYQNYQFILNAIIRMVMIVYHACLASVGNSLVAETREKNFGDLNRLSFITCWVCGFCSACLMCLYQPFMEIWVGRDLMLGFGAVVCFVAYFYVRGMSQLLDTYKDAAGMWHRDRFRPLVTAVLNLTLNLIMVRFMGIYGIILSTVFSVVLVGLPWELWTLFTGLFDRSLLWEYTGKLCFYTLVSAAACVVTYFLCAALPFTGFAALLVRGLICCGVPNILFFLIYRKRREFLESLSLADHMTGGRFRPVLKILGLAE